MAQADGAIAAYCRGVRVECCRVVVLLCVVLLWALLLTRCCSKSPQRALGAALCVHTVCRRYQSVRELLAPKLTNTRVRLRVRVL